MRGARRKAGQGTALHMQRRRRVPTLRVTAGRRGGIVMKWKGKTDEEYSIERAIYNYFQ